MTTDQKHTPEPWVVEYGSSDWGLPVSHVIRADAFTGAPRIDYLAEVFSIQPYCLGASQKDLNFAETQRANARRIVACVNACEGIPTDHLENFGLPPFDALAAKVKELKAQRDELLKFAKHRNDAGAFCGLLKHPEYGCTCGCDALIAKIEAEKQNETE